MDEIREHQQAFDGLALKGTWIFTCRDRHGRIKWVETAKNLITNQGLDHALDVLFHGASQVTTWYIGLKGAGTVAASDTLASHAGWTENENYTGDRKEFVEAAASSRSITNSANKASFAITSDSQTIAGAFLSSAATGTSGTLFSGVDFTGGSKSCDNGDTLEVTYTINASNAS